MKDINNKELKKFGIIFFIVLFFVGLMLLRKKHILPSEIVLGLSLMVGFLAFLKPILLKPIHSGLMRFSKIIGWINTHLLLLIIFYCIFAPIGLIFRIIRKDPLNRKIDKNAVTYWIEKEDEFNSVRCERQF